jgi:hypothetical protein
MLSLDFIVSQGRLKQREAPQEKWLCANIVKACRNQWEL